MADKLTETMDLKPCPFCGGAMVVSGGFNPMGQCETPGCWMRERRIGFPVDDPKQVAAWNTRAALSRPNVDEMREALEKCRAKFLHYEDLHRLKCTSEGDEKADRNREMADMCTAALGSAS